MIPLVVNTPEAMVKLRVIPTRDYSEQTLKAWHGVGVLACSQMFEFSTASSLGVSFLISEGSLLNNIFTFLGQKRRMVCVNE